MFERFHRTTLAATAAALIAALGVGGVAVAQNSGAPAKPATPATKAAPATKADDHADGETNDDGPGKADNHADGETNDDGPGKGADRPDKGDAKEKHEKAGSDKAEGPEAPGTPDRD